MAYICTTDTPVGPFTVIATDDDAVLASGWTDHRDRLIGYVAETLQPRQITRRADDAPPIVAVAAYHDGDVTAPEAVAVRHASGPFRAAAWDVLRAVGAGEVISYTELARRAGSPQAVRAAGSACARNPAALFIPCHRVRRTDGALGGFGYGLAVKRWLLAHEGVDGTDLPL